MSKALPKSGVNRSGASILVFSSMDEVFSFQDNGRAVTWFSRLSSKTTRVLKDLFNQLLAMKTEKFEELISLLLAEIGFEMVEDTKQGHDGGIDVRSTLELDDIICTKMAFQVKKWKPKRNI